MRGGDVGDALEGKLWEGELWMRIAWMVSGGEVRLILHRRRRKTEGAACRKRSGAWAVVQATEFPPGVVRAFSGQISAESGATGREKAPLACLHQRLLQRPA